MIQKGQVVRKNNQVVRNFLEPLQNFPNKTHQHPAFVQDETEHKYLIFQKTLNIQNSWNIDSSYQLTFSVTKKFLMFYDINAMSKTKGIAMKWKAPKMLIA